jgi:hypothetical protein
MVLFYLITIDKYYLFIFLYIKQQGPTGRICAPYAHGAKQGLWENYANMLVETLWIRQVLMYLKFFPKIIIISNI